MSGPPAAPSRLPAALAVIAITLAAYLVFLAALSSRYQWNPSALVGLGARQDVNTSGNLPAGLIVFEGDGYDGQYFYHVALGFVRRANLGAAPVRYQRIIYPLLIAAAALGNEQLLPAAMLAVNLAALLAGTGIFILLLRFHNASPWFGLAYGLNPGQILGVQMDLAFPVQMALATAALWCWERGRIALTAVLIGVSILTSESTVLFLLPLLAGEALARRWRNVGVLGASVLPFLASQVVLEMWLGTPGVEASADHVVWPFAGIVPVLARMSASGSLFSLLREGAVLAVMGIGIAALFVSLWKLREQYDAYTGGILCHAGFSLFASRSIWEAYASAGRVFSGLFIFLPLSYVTRRDRATAVLLIASALLGLVTFLRPFTVTPYVPYTLTR